MYHIFFIHSSVDGHLGCFQVLATVSSVAMNIGVQMAFHFYLLYSRGKLHSFVPQVFSDDPLGAGGYVTTWVHEDEQGLVPDLKEVAMR